MTKKQEKAQKKQSSRFRPFVLAFALTLGALPFSQGVVNAAGSGNGNGGGGSLDSALKEDGNGRIYINVGDLIEGVSDGNGGTYHCGGMGAGHYEDADGVTTGSCWKVEGGSISAPSDGPPPPPPYTEKWEYYIHYTGEVNRDICSISGAGAPWQDPKYQYERTIIGPSSFGTTTSFNRGGVYLIKAVPVSQYGVRNWNGEAKQFWISVNNDVTGKTLSLPADSCKQKSILGLSGGGMVQGGFINKDKKVQKERGTFNNRQERYRDYIKNYGG